MCFVDGFDRSVGNLRDLRRFEGTRLGRSTHAVEKPHLAKEVAVFHEGNYRLTSVDRLVRDGDTARDDDVQRVGVLTFRKQNVASPQRLFGRCGGKFRCDARVDIAKQIY